jgi:hypothetical protein
MVKDPYDFAVHYNMPEREYHTHKAFSASWAKARTPAHAMTRKETTPAMRMGTAIHSVILGAGASPTLAPDLDWRKKETKDAAALVCAQLGLQVTPQTKAEFDALCEQAGLMLMSAAEMTTIANVADAVASHPEASALLSEGKPEVSIIGTIDEVPVKARIDWYRPGVLVDLKTTSDASEDAFQRQSYNLGYHIQMAWYRDMLRGAAMPVNECYIIAVESAAPHGVMVYQMDPAAMALGEEIYMAKLAQYGHCLDFGRWPGYDTGIHTLTLPRWAR